MKPPDSTDWIVMFAVATMAALVGGLSRYQSSQKSSDKLLLFVIEALTVFFVTTVTYLVLHSLVPLLLLTLAQFWPGLAGAEIPSYGIAGMAGIVGHFGLHKTVATVAKILERR